MNVIGHHHKGMQNIVSENLSIVPNGLRDHVREGWLAKVERTGASLVKEPIQCGKRSPGRQGTPGEWAILRQTAVQPPSEENWLFGVPDVGKATLIQHFTEIVPGSRVSSLQS